MSAGRIAGLDVLRGLAILLVVLRHAVPDVFAGAGVVGVVMFFTLSGYLITGVLAKELSTTGRVDYRRFYLRRARRLLPALVALAAVFAVVTLVFDPLGDRDRLPATTAVLLTFTGNLPVADVSAAAFHSWTLATEEQFYLLWPALLALAWARGRVGAALVATAVAVLGAVLAWLWPYADNAYVLPTSWFLCFVIGAATRLRGDASRIPAALVPLVLAALAALSVVPLRGHALTYLVAAPAIACFTAVLLLAWSRWTDLTHHVARGLAALGVVSYGAYLWNYPLTLWLRPDLGAAAGPLAAALTIVAAALSWRFVEEPVMRRVRTRGSP
ncbi:acyltransferase family protein [Actinophytocola sp. KF-1]